MVDISVVSVTNGEQREKLPFKKPTACSLCKKIINTTKTFVFMASVLNMTAARVIAQTPTDSFSFFLTFFPLVSIGSIICVQTEFTMREWVYYRMLEHNVIINFPPQRSSYFSLLHSAAALWILGGALLMVVLMAYNASSGGIRWPIPGWPYSEMLQVGFTAYLMIDGVHTLRQITKRFPNINTLIEGNREDALAWIRQLEVMPEDAVQYHFLHVTEAARAASSNRGSTSDVPQNGVSEGIDFAKVGKEGYTKESFDQLRRSGRGKDSVLGCVGEVIAGSQWARLAKPNLYVVKADAQLVKQVNSWMLICLVASVFILFFNITTSGDLGDKIWAYFMGNATAS